VIDACAAERVGSGAFRRTEGDHGRTGPQPELVRGAPCPQGMLHRVPNLGDFLNRAVQVGLDLLNSSTKEDDGRRQQAGPPRAGQDGRGVRTVPTSERAREIAYAPDMDGAADPGEIVWTWVPFEEDASQGKDRPVLVFARAFGAGELLGLMLSSQGHRADDANWLPIGSGPWDREGRDSYVRLDRVLEVPEHGIRREGAVMPRDRFDRVAGELRGSYGWR
jgi:hypothetical protein